MDFSRLIFCTVWQHCFRLNYSKIVVAIYCSILYIHILSFIFIVILRFFSILKDSLLALNITVFASSPISYFNVQYFYDFATLFSILLFLSVSMAEQFIYISYLYINIHSASL